MKEKENKFFNLPGNMNLSLFFAVSFLIAFGIIMVYSSSFNILIDRQGKVLPLLRQFWFKQMIYGLFGLVTMYLVSRVLTKKITEFSVILYLFTLVLMAYTVINGEVFRGASRSFDLGFISFQPSEFLKISVILILASLVQYRHQNTDTLKTFGILLTVLIVPVGLVMTEDFSSGIVLAMIGASIIFVGYRNWKHTMLIGGPLGLMMTMSFFFLRSYRAERSEAFKAGIWSDPDGIGRQAVQSLLAIGSGGFFGRGLGQSLQKMGRITQAHHDIIFAVICEELGFFGAFLILCLYLGILYSMMQIAFEAEELKEFLIVVGVMTHIAMQVIINIGVASNLIPNTGMPLPFISYGGSSMVILCAEMGLVLGISKKNQFLRIKRLEEIEEAGRSEV